MDDKMKVVLFGHYFNLHPQDAYYHIQQLTNVFAEFTEAFKERIELEIDYSKDLIKISKCLEKYIHSKESTPISYIASALKVQHEERARNALELADYIHTEIQVPCLNLLMQNREALKKMEKQFKKLYREGETVQDIYQKHLKKYHRIHQEWEEKVIAKNIMNFTPGITNSQKEKAYIKLQQQKKQKEQHQSRYIASLQNFNSFATRYNNAIGGYMSELQGIAIQQITLQMDSMRKLIVSEVNMFKNIEYDLLNISKQMESISPHSQLQHFVAEKKDSFTSPIISIYSEGPVEPNRYQFIDLKSPINRSLLDQTLLKIDKNIFPYLLQNKNNNKLKGIIYQLIKRNGKKDQSLNHVEALRDIVQLNKSLRNVPIDGKKSQMLLINQVTAVCVQIIQGIIDILASDKQKSQQSIKPLYQMLSHYMSIHHFYRFITFTTLNQFQNVHEQTISNPNTVEQYLTILKSLLQKSLNAKDIFVARAIITLMFSVNVKIGTKEKHIYECQCFAQVQMHENLDFWLSIIFQSTYELLTLIPSGQKEQLKQVYLMRQKNVIFSGLLTYCHYMIVLGIQVSFVKSIMFWFCNIYHLNKEHQTDLAKTIASSLQIYKSQ